MKNFSFQVCTNGTAVLGQCQPGLHFNTNLNQCDHPFEPECIEVDKSQRINNEETLIMQFEISRTIEKLQHPYQQPRNTQLNQMRALRDLHLHIRQLEARQKKARPRRSINRQRQTTHPQNILNLQLRRACRRRSIHRQRQTTHRQTILNLQLKRA